MIILSLYLIVLKDGRTPIYYAAMNGHTEIVEVLIQAKANINLQHKVTLFVSILNTRVHL